jgi:hypothetical protein
MRVRYGAYGCVECTPAGDPVDPSTGLFILEKTDLALPDVIPITLRRTYRPADANPAWGRDLRHACAASRNLSNR